MLKAFYKTKEVFIGGRVTIKKRVLHELSRYELSPSQTRTIFKEKKWNSVVAFHTRNPPHCAHEWLQRMALESYDGLLIHPILGQKKPGDFLPMSVINGYQLLISKYYPLDRVVLSALTISGRYAGPREAIHHLLVRQSLGFDYFYIGRDHAGAENLYEQDEAIKIVKKFQHKFKIKPFISKGGFYCGNCNRYLIKDSCSHKKLKNISGTEFRHWMNKKKLYKHADKHLQKILFKIKF